eukprot:gnl/MRDRNA2_/MRDRNA2_73554_c0_seq1.p1 gnl/MRDRNA2_/MRDRNA2_73554_c0~~gnl/MRDRNA2_/MRDRNA2_73554_c0_seq1.p1  ORF type:complete len:536 (+),score=102.45 gnl/MRDRNA2_/MRDRNA2_73554_c0_seq1:108-1610(+)
MNLQIPLSVSPAPGRLSVSSPRIVARSNPELLTRKASSDSHRTSTRTPSPVRHYNVICESVGHFSNGPRSVSSGTKNAFGTDRMPRTLSASSSLVHRPAAGYSQKRLTTLMEAQSASHVSGGSSTMNGKANSESTYKARYPDALGKETFQPRPALITTQKDQATRGAATNALGTPGRSATDLSNGFVRSASPRRPLTAEEQPKGLQTESTLTLSTQVSEATQEVPPTDDLPRRIKEAERTAELAAQECASIWHYFELQVNREQQAASKEYERRILTLQKKLEMLEYEANSQQLADRRRLCDLREQWSRQRDAWVEMEETLTGQLRTAEQELALMRTSPHNSLTAVQIGAQNGKCENRSLEKWLAARKAAEKEVIRELHRVRDQLESVRAAADPDFQSKDPRVQMSPFGSPTKLGHLNGVHQDASGQRVLHASHSGSTKRFEGGSDCVQYQCLYGSMEEQLDSTQKEMQSLKGELLATLAELKKLELEESSSPPWTGQVLS